MVRQHFRRHYIHAAGKCLGIYTHIVYVTKGIVVHIIKGQLNYSQLCFMSLSDTATNLLSQVGPIGIGHWSH